MQDIIIGNLNGVDKNLYKRIAQGKVKPDHVLDLHGFSEIAAREEVIKHIEAAYYHGFRLILVITGKGGADRPGVLKSNIGRFLNSQEIAYMILFAIEAARRHGGSGAFYVYLKKNR